MVPKGGGVGGLLGRLLCAERGCVKMVGGEEAIKNLPRQPPLFISYICPERGHEDRHIIFLPWCPFLEP